MAPVKHGANITGKRTPLYRIWLNMRNRCTNPNHSRYKWYGARGVRVCERWDDFAIFRADVGDPPAQGYTLDRYPNRNGDYEPGNVRWATWEEQANNKDSVRLVTLPDGRRMSVAMAARVTGINRLTLNSRLKRGCSQDHLFMSAQG